MAEGVDLRVAYLEAALRAAATAAGFGESQFSEIVEQAERWRNDPTLTALIVTIAGRDEAKISSLEDFTIVSSRDLKETLVQRAQAGPAGANEVQARWWRLLGQDESISLGQVADYYLAITDPSVDFKAASSAQIGRLGFLSDAALFDNPSERALRQRIDLNHDLMRRLQTLTERDRRLIAENLAALDDDERGAGQKVLRKFQLLKRGVGEKEPMTVDEARLLLGLRSKKKEEKDTTNGTDKVRTQEEAAGYSARELMRPKADLAPLDDVVEQYRDQLNSEEDRPAFQPLVADAENQPSVVSTPVRSDLVNLIRKVIGPGQYGGLIATEEESIDATLRRFQEDEDILATWGTKTVEDLFSGLASPAIDAITSLFRQFNLARTEIAPLAAVLAVEPLTTASSPTYGRQISAYVGAYFALLAAANDQYAALFADFGADTDVLISQLLLFDLIVFKTGDKPNVLLSPLHPLYLWHFSEFARLVREQQERLSKDDEELVIEAAAHLPNFLSSVCVPEAVLGSTTSVPYLGSFGSLPYYGASADTGVANDGASRVQEVISAFLEMHPPSRQALRLALIDAPSAGPYMSFLADLASSGELNGAHVTLLRSRAKATDKSGEVTLGVSDDVEAEVSRWFASSSDATKFSFNVLELDSLDAFPPELRPHVVVAFDQTPGRQTPSSGSAHLIQPLAVRHHLRYRPLTKRVELEPAPGGIFASYHELAGRLAKTPQASYLSVHQADDLRAKLRKLAESSPWIVIADRSIDRDLQLGALRIYTGHEDERDVAAFSDSADALRRTLRDVARQYNTFITDEELDALLQELSDLLESGVLTLRPDRSGRPNHGQIKGLLGTLIAARWYRQHSGPDHHRLLLSVDSDEARRWLHLSPDPNRADLLGFEFGQEGGRLSIIEVKTMQDASGEYEIKDGVVSGSAVEQVLSTKRLLSQVFAADRASELITTPARREIVREHVYKELARARYGGEERKEWVERLDPYFDGELEVSLQCHLIEVRLGVDNASLSARELRASDNGDYVPLWITQLNETGIASLRQREETSPPIDSRGTAQTQESASRVPQMPEPVANVPRPERSAPSAAPEALARGSPAALDVHPRPRALLGEAAGAYGKQREIWFDPEFAARALPNPHISITGETGSGKTQAIKTLLLELKTSSLPTLILDFKDDYSDTAYAQAEEFRVFDATQGGLPFSPMIPPVDRQTGRISPINHVHQLGEIVKRVYKLGDQQAFRMREALKEAYEHRGIGVQPFMPTGSESYPAFEDVHALLSGDKENEALLGRLSPIFDLGLFRAAFDEIAFSDLANRPTVVRLSQLPGDEVKNAVAEFFLMALYNYLIRLPHPHSLQRVLVLDEAWRLVHSPFLEPLLREGRAFGLGVFLASQFPSDLPTAVSGSTATKLYFSQTKAENIREIQRSLIGKTSGPDAEHLGTTIRGLQPLNCLIQNSQFMPYVRVAMLPYFQRKAQTG
jgi:hypothetical protein